MRIILPLIITLALTAVFGVRVLADQNDDIDSIYKEGLSLCRQGKFIEAKERFEAVLKIDPTYEPARSKISLILNIQSRLARIDANIASKEKVLDVLNKWFPPKKEQPQKQKPVFPSESKSERQKVMEEKSLQIIPEINFTDAHLRDVLQYLSRISGVNIILDEDLYIKQGTDVLGIKAEPQADLPEETEMTESEEEEPAGETTEPDSDYKRIISDRVTIHLKNIPLIEALKYILNAKGLKYRIDEYAIVVSSPARFNEVEMETRYYHLVSGIGAFTEYIEAVKEDESVNFEWEEEDKKGQDTNLTIKDVLEQSGVPFPQGSKIFLDRRTGTLIIRNTPANLEIIENILSILDITPFQVEIEARFVQLKQSTAEELGLEWMITTNGLTFGNGRGVRVDATTQDPVFGQYPGTGGKEGFTKGLRFLNDVNDKGDILSPVGSILSISGVLTQPKFRMILHALNQSGNAKLMSAPKVTTLNNQKAQIQMVDEFIYPSEFEVSAPTIRATYSAKYTSDSSGNYSSAAESVSSQIVTPGLAVPVGFETRDIGIILNVIPSVGADRKTITLTMIPEISEFVEWLDYGIQEGVGWNKVPIRKPVFETRNVTTSVILTDGETAVLGGLIKEEMQNSEDKIPVLGDIPFVGSLFRSKTSQAVKTNLIIFVTAKLITPSGELVKDAKQYTYEQ